MELRCIENVDWMKDHKFLESGLKCGHERASTNSQGKCLGRESRRKTILMSLETRESYKFDRVSPYKLQIDLCKVEHSYL